MTKKKEAPFNNPFSKLSSIKAESRKVPPAPARIDAPAKRQTAAEDEARLFLESVGEVQRVKASFAHVTPNIRSMQQEATRDEAESLVRLSELVTHSSKFESTGPEAEHEGWVSGFDQRVIRKLRAGDFKVEASIDLHGKSSDDARSSIARFISASRVAGHRVVLVITGRGLHSENQSSTLRANLGRWINESAIQRHVLAYCQARPHEGGDGAFYVLLRR